MEQHYLDKFLHLDLLSSKLNQNNSTKAEVENQLDRKIKRLRSDRDGEYDTNSLSIFCEKNGIIHETSAPYTPQQNGIAERKNRTLKEIMNAMLISSGLPDNMWGEAVLTACFILNRVPHKKLDQTPYELWKGYAPNLNYLKVWGCLAKVALPSHKRTNIGPKTFDVVFIGYAQNSAAYRFLSLSDHSISEYRDAEFFEHVFPLKKKAPNVVPDVMPENVNLPTSSSDARVIVTEPIRSKRLITKTSFGPDFVTAFLVETFDNLDIDVITEELVSIFLIEEDPKTYQEAVRSIDDAF